MSEIPASNNDPLKDLALGFKLTILGSIVVILLIIGIFFLGSKDSFKKPSKIEQGIKVLSAQLKSPGVEPSVIANVQKNLDEALLRTDDIGQYKYLFYASAAGATAYSSSHNPKLREFLEALDNFVSQNYPEFYRKSDFYVLCSDEECGKISIPAEIAKIKEEIEKNDLGLNKQTMLNALYDASLVVENPTTEAEKNRQRDNYLFVLQLLEEEAKRGNQLAASLTKDLENYLKANLNIDFKELKSRIPVATEGAKINY